MASRDMAIMTSRRVKPPSPGGEGRLFCLDWGKVEEGSLFQADRGVIGFYGVEKGREHEAYDIFLVIGQMEYGLVHVPLFVNPEGYVSGSCFLSCTVEDVLEAY